MCLVDYDVHNNSHHYSPLYKGCTVGESVALEVCMGMGKTGIPWDSHGNGNTISHGNGNGMGMGIKTWEWEKITAYCNYSKLCDSREFMGSEVACNRLQWILWPPPVDCSITNFYN